MTEHDPVTFKSSGSDAVWSKDAFSKDTLTFEIPSGTCGFSGVAISEYNYGVLLPLIPAIGLYVFYRKRFPTSVTKKTK